MTTVTAKFKHYKTSHEFKCSNTKSLANILKEISVHFGISSNSILRVQFPDEEELDLTKVLPNCLEEMTIITTGFFHVSFPHGIIITMPLNRLETVAELKDKISKETNTPASIIRLIKNDVIFQDHQLLAQCRIQDQETIQLRYVPPAGVSHDAVPFRVGFPIPARDSDKNHRPSKEDGCGGVFTYVWISPDATVDELAHATRTTILTNRARGKLNKGIYGLNLLALAVPFALFRKSERYNVYKYEPLDALSVVVAANLKPGQIIFGFFSEEIKIQLYINSLAPDNVYTVTAYTSDTIEQFKAKVLQKYSGSSDSGNNISEEGKEMKQERNKSTSRDDVPKNMYLSLYSAPTSQIADKLHDRIKRLGWMSNWSNREYSHDSWLDTYTYFDDNSLIANESLHITKDPAARPIYASVQFNFTIDVIGESFTRDVMVVSLTISTSCNIWALKMRLEEIFYIPADEIKISIRSPHGSSGHVRHSDISNADNASENASKRQRLMISSSSSVSEPAINESSWDNNMSHPFDLGAKDGDILEIKRLPTPVGVFRVYIKIIVSEKEQFLYIDTNPDEKVNWVLYYAFQKKRSPNAKVISIETKDGKVIEAKDLFDIQVKNSGISSGDTIIANIQIYDLNQPIQILVSGLNGQLAVFDVRLSDTVDQLKIKCQDKWGIHPDDQQLRYHCAMHYGILNDYKIRPETKIHLMGRLRGS